MTHAERADRRRRVNDAFCSGKTIAPADDLIPVIRREIAHGSVSPQRNISNQSADQRPSGTYHDEKNKDKIYEPAADSEPTEQQGCDEHQTHHNSTQPSPPTAQDHEMAGHQEAGKQCRNLISGRSR